MGVKMSRDEDLTDLIVPLIDNRNDSSLSSHDIIFIHY
jgi:hypothetical protein